MLNRVRASIQPPPPLRFERGNERVSSICLKQPGLTASVPGEPEMREQQAGDLQIRQDHDATTSVVWLAGEFGVGGVDDFYGLSDRMVDIAPERVVLDLRRVYFIDSAGLGALLLLQQRLGAVGSTLVLQRPHPNVADLLDATRLSKEFVVQE